MPTHINLSLLYSYTLGHFAKLKSMCILLITTTYTLNASIQFDIYMLWAPHVRKISLSV